MQELSQLINNVEIEKQKANNLLYYGNGESLESKLFELVKSGKVKSDLEAVFALYSENKVSSKYKMLKSRLKRKLYNQVHFIDFTTSKNSAAILEQKCYKLLYEASTLTRIGEFKLADRILSQLLNLAEEGVFNDIILSALELKRLSYVESFNKTLFDENEKNINKYKAIVSKEKEADTLYFKTRVELGVNIFSRENYYPQTLEVVEKIKKLWLETDSPHIFNRYFFLKVTYLEMAGEYKDLAKTAQEVELLIQRGEVNSFRFNLLFCKYISVYGYLQSRLVEEGLKYAKMYISSFVEGAINWFSFMENYVLLAIHNKDYKLAEELIYKVVNNPEYSRISKLADERWKLYISYFNLISPKSVERTEVASKPLAEIFSEITKDKKGFNVLVIILELLRRLEKGEHEKIQLQYDNLKKYSSYHLKGDEAERVRTFFRLILLVIREEFDKARCSSKGSYLFKKLKALPTPAGAFAEVEIVPYEHLWEFILEHLERKPFYV